MRHVFAQAALALAALSLLATPATSQLPLPGGGGPLVRVGFGGGVSVPVSDTREALRNGINGQAYVLVNTGFLPLRFNIGYQRFEFDDASLTAASGTSTIFSGVGGLSVGLLKIGPLQPFITAGLGAFHVDNELEGSPAGSTSQVRFGIDGGAGVSLQIGRLNAFIEGRVQNVYTDGGIIDANAIRTIPVTFGILF